MQTVGSYERISKISVRQDGEGDYAQIGSLVLYDEGGSPVFSKRFSSSAGDWRERAIEVPEEQVICGIDVTTHNAAINRLSFRMATAANFIKKDRSNEIPKFITRTVHQRRSFNRGANDNCWPKPADCKSISKPLKL